MNFRSKANEYYTEPIVDQVIIIKVNDYYKLINDYETWFKITKITDDKYYVKTDITYKDKLAGRLKGKFDKNYLDLMKKTGKLKKLSIEELKIFNL